MKCGKESCHNGIIEIKTWVGKILPKELRSDFDLMNNRPETNGIHKIGCHDLKDLGLSCLLYNHDKHLLKLAISS